MAHAYPKLHNAMWPGLVGKEAGDRSSANQPGADARTDCRRVGEQRQVRRRSITFCFILTQIPDANDDELRRIADLIARHGFKVGSLVAPVWPGTVGDSSMGDAIQRGKFVAVRKACRIAKIFNEHGVRETTRRIRRVEVERAWRSAARCRGRDLAKWTG